VGILFIAYAGSMSYFNYYIHEINRQIVKLYFTTYTRYAMIISLSLCLREAIVKGKKELALRNPNPENNIVYLMDAINFIQDANHEEIEFTKTASKSVFGRYIQFIEDAEKYFCSASDSYNASQTMPCEKYYVGPKTQGFYASCAYYTDYFTQYSNILQNVDLSNLEVRSKLATDPQTTTISIFFFYRNPKKFQ